MVFLSNFYVVRSLVYPTAPMFNPVNQYPLGFLGWIGGFGSTRGGRGELEKKIRWGTRTSKYNEINP